MLDHLKNHRIILGSQSPRRRHLMAGLNINFEVAVGSGDESFDLKLQKEEIPLFLAEKKAKEIAKNLTGNYILITCDTIVWKDNKVLNKPNSIDDAFAMLNELSGKWHTVYTGVNIVSNSKNIKLFDQTNVHFKKLNISEINYYVSNYKPFDKAGSYGVQEWLGYIAIDRIEGCFFNVMGLPLNKIYDALKNLIIDDM